MFADDTSLFQSGKQKVLAIHSDKLEITNWCACSKLSINSPKSETISFVFDKPPGSKNDKINIPDKYH